MLDSLQTGIWRLLGRDVDPLGTISPEQLKAVLKSIEGKYNSLRDENKRLKGLVGEHVETIERLKSDLKEARESTTPRGADVLKTERDELSAQLEELQRKRALERSEWEARLSELEGKLIDQQRLRLEDDALRQVDRDQQQALELRHQEELAKLKDQQQAQSEALEFRHQVELSKLREELERMQAQVSRQASDTEIRDRLDSEKQTLRVRVDELTAERDQLEAELQAVRSRATELRTVVKTGPAVSPQAPPKPSTPSESPDRRELLARLLGGGQ